MAGRKSKINPYFQNFERKNKPMKYFNNIAIQYLLLESKTLQNLSQPLFPQSPILSQLATESTNDRNITACLADGILAEERVE